MLKSILRIMCVCTLLFCSGYASAASITTIYFRNQPTNQPTNQTDEKITVTSKTASHANIPKDSKGLNMAVGSYVTVSIIPGFKITKITVAFTESLGTPLDISCGGEFAISEKIHTWEGTVEPSFVLTNRTGSKVYINYIDIEYSESIKVDRPMFSVVGGTYSKTQTVELKSATEGASILYSLDGTAPTIAGGVLGETTKVYAEPISISQTKKIMAVGVKDGMANSDVVSQSYIIIGPNSEVTTRIEFIKLLDNLFVDGNVKPVSLKDIKRADLSNVFNISFLSKNNSYSNLDFAGEISLPPSGYIDLSPINSGVVIEKVVIKMLKDNPGVKFLDINGERKWVLVDTNQIEWTGAETKSVEIENPQFDSDDYTAYISEISITYKQAEQALSIADVATMIENNTAGYFLIDQLKVGFHSGNDLYLTDNANWIYVASDNAFGNRQFNNGDVIIEPLICKIPQKITTPIEILNQVQVYYSGADLVSELMTIKESLMPINQNSLVSFIHTTFDETNSILTDKSGTVKVEQRYETLLKDKQSYNVNGVMGCNAGGETMFYPTQIVKIITAVDNAVVGGISISNVQGGILITAVKNEVISIYNSVGQKIKEIVVNAGDNHVYLENGIYLINGKSISKKVIIK